MMPKTRRTRTVQRARLPARTTARPAPSRRAPPEPQQAGGSFRWWYAAWVPTVAASVVLAAVFLGLFAAGTWVVAAVVWMAYVVSIPVSGMAVAIPLAVLLPSRRAAGLALGVLAAAVPAALWSARYVLERIDGGAEALNSPGVLAMSEVWTLAAILMAAAVLTLISAALHALVGLFSRR